MSNQTVMNENEEFQELCVLVDLKEEYPGFEGDVRYAVITDLKEEELEQRFGSELEDFRPYMLLPSKFEEPRRTFRLNERRHQHIAKVHQVSYRPEDPEVVSLQSDLVESEPTPEEYMIILEEKERLKELIIEGFRVLTEVQRRRMTAIIVDGLTIREAAEAEGVTVGHFSMTLERACERLKLYFIGAVNNQKLAEGGIYRR